MAIAKAVKANPRVETAKYNVLSCLDHDGFFYNAGAPITLDAETATVLLELKVIERAKD